MGKVNVTLEREPDLEAIYVNSCRLLPENKTAIFVGSQSVEGASELFYAPVLVSDKCTLKGMLDSGSMSCTLSEEGEQKLRTAGVLPPTQPAPAHVVLVGCGGLSIVPTQMQSGNYATGLTSLLTEKLVWMSPDLVV